MKTALQILDAMIEEYKFDSNRVFIFDMVRERIQKETWWNEFSEISPKEGTSIIVYCSGVYTIADVDDWCLVMDNEWEYEWTHWMPLPLPPNE